MSFRVRADARTETTRNKKPAVFVDGGRFGRASKADVVADAEPSK